MNTKNTIPEEKTVSEQPKRGEIIAGTIILIIFAFLAYKGLHFIFANSPLDSIPTSASAPVVAQPVSAQNIVVTSQIVKAVGGKYRYFFDIRNQDEKPFSGDVKIELDKSSGEHIYDDSFSTSQPIQPGVGTSQFVETYTGPISVHGSDGVETFKYTVSSGGSVVKTGQGTISTKLEGY
ncbi:hypothetical protein BH11PAT2_BH11PAT2_04720 [soil metagenome]